MLQIDHVYEFFNNTLFKQDFELFSFPKGVPPSLDNFYSIIFTREHLSGNIFFYDQEPLLPGYTDSVINLVKRDFQDQCVNTVFVNSEHSDYKQQLLTQHNFKDLYYFFHGYAALDWYRGFYALNYNQNVITNYDKDFVSYNRIVTGDRSYRMYFVSKLVEYNLLDQGLVSFGVTDNSVHWRDELDDDESKLSPTAREHILKHLSTIPARLIIDKDQIHGSASADVARRGIITENVPEQRFEHDPWALWHVVTETAFYQNKLHLTEKIFKPIVSKQPFMLLASPGNLEYLRDYGFKTFEGIIDESYDLIKDNDQRVNAVVAQLAWYCNLSQEEKQAVIERLAPIVEYNFQHFYGEFKHIITRELLDNCKTVFKEIGYDDKTIAYENIYHVLTS